MMTSISQIQKIVIWKHKFLKLFCIFVSCWQMTYAISGRATAALLAFIKQFVNVLSKDSNDIEAISLIIDNKDQAFTEFVACSKCFIKFINF